MKKMQESDQLKKALEILVAQTKDFLKVKSDVSFSAKQEFGPVDPIPLLRFFYEKSNDYLGSENIELDFVLKYYYFLDNTIEDYNRQLRCMEFDKEWQSIRGKISL